MLTHARAITADGSLGDDFEALRRSVLARRHDLGALAGEIADLRRRLMSPDDRADIWDVGRLRGGPGDLELAAEFLQLAGAVRDGGVGGLAATFELAAAANCSTPRSPMNWLATPSSGRTCPASFG